MSIRGGKKILKENIEKWVGRKLGVEVKIKLAYTIENGGLVVAEREKWEKKREQCKKK